MLRRQSQLFHRRNLISKLFQHSSRCSSCIVLGIETSCDDTAVAVVNSDGQILGEARSNQLLSHEPHGGIVPHIASKLHARHLPTLIHQVLIQSSVRSHQLSAIGATRGPGLPSSLSVGLHCGKAIAATLNIPFIGVHHMEAHALTPRLTSLPKLIPFPFYAFLISGGHTVFLLVHGVGNYQQIGTTLDDSVGEAYDKVASSLNIKWKIPKSIRSENEESIGAGAALEAVALLGNSKKFPFPIPLRYHSCVDFSFSGLKTSVNAVINDLKSTNSLSDTCVADIAASFQYSAIEHLACQLEKGMLKTSFEYKNSVQSMVVSGGVACNVMVRQRLTEVAVLHGLNIVFPPPKLCSDNGVMIAWAAIERLNIGSIDGVGEEIDIIPKWPLDETCVQPKGKQKRINAV